MLCSKCGKSLESSDKVGLCGDCEEEKITTRLEGGIKTKDLGSEIKLEDENEDQESEESSGSSDFGLAGFWLRVGAYLIDSAIVGIFCLIITLIVQINLEYIITNFVNEKILFKLPFAVMMIAGIILPILIAMFYLLFISFAVGLLYYPLFENSKFGGTPGKILLGLKVIDNEEKTITLGTAFLRQFIRFVSFFFFGFGQFMVLLTKHKQAAHDYISETYVVKSKLVNPFYAFGLGFIALITICTTQALKPGAKDNNHQKTSSTTRANDATTTRANDSTTTFYKEKYLERTLNSNALPQDIEKNDENEDIVAPEPKSEKLPIEKYETDKSEFDRRLEANKALNNN